MSQRRPPVALHGLLHAETVCAIAALPREVEAIADRWACAWPAKLKRLEVEGILLERLHEQHHLERAALERASGPDYAHLAEHEKLEILGPPLEP
jgi:hypothetical protein